MYEIEIDYDDIYERDILTTIKWRGITVVLDGNDIRHVEASLTNQIALLYKALCDDLEVANQFIVECELLVKGDLTIDIDSWLAYDKKDDVLEEIAEYYLSEIMESV